MLSSDFPFSSNLAICLATHTWHTQLPITLAAFLALVPINFAFISPALSGHLGEEMTLGLGGCPTLPLRC